MTCLVTLFKWCYHLIKNSSNWYYFLVSISNINWILFFYRFGIFRAFFRSSIQFLPSSKIYYPPIVPLVWDSLLGLHLWTQRCQIQSLKTKSTVTSNFLNNKRDGQATLMLDNSMPRSEFSKSFLLFCSLITLTGELKYFNQLKFHAFSDTT